MLPLNIALANIGLFYSVHQPPLVPDVLVSLDVEVPVDVILTGEERAEQERLRAEWLAARGAEPDEAIEPRITPPEWERAVQEVWALFKETDRKIPEVSKSVGTLTGKGSRFMEGLIAPGAATLRESENLLRVPRRLFLPPKPGLFHEPCQDLLELVQRIDNHTFLEEHFQKRQLLDLLDSFDDGLRHHLKPRLKDFEDPSACSLPGTSPTRPRRSGPNAGGAAGSP